MAKPLADKGGRCPICARPSIESYRPFCSRRCADVDLSRWLRGRYAIPGEPQDTDGAAPPAPSEPEPGKT
jgi:endogenous inhibitor of DNA gyrase (YacG/DUF329 family)